MPGPEFERIKVLVETEERNIRGYIYKPVEDGGNRLSDYLNAYGDRFLRMVDVEILERGRTYKVEDKQRFVAVSVAAITYITPLEEPK